MNTLPAAPVFEHGAALCVRAVDVAQFGASAGPLLSIHHFEMFRPFFGPHPHAGFSAVTYLFEDSEGSFLDRDSLGARVHIAPGDVLWTFAGAGVLHDERPVVPDQRCHGLQLFVNASEAFKHAPPKAHHLAAGDVPLFGGEGLRVRVLSGRYEGMDSPLSPPEPFTMLDVTLQADAELKMEPRAGWTIVAYVVSGEVTVRSLPGHARLGQAESLAITAEEQLSIRANSATAQVMIFSGPEWHEPVFAEGPFVMSNREDLRKAQLDFHAGRMGALARED